MPVWASIVVIRAGGVLYLVRLRRSDVTLRAYPGLDGNFLVSLDLDVQQRCPRDAAVCIISVDGDRPELGDALHVEVMVRGDQGDEGSHQDRAEKDGERDHSLRHDQCSTMIVKAWHASGRGVVFLAPLA